MVDQHKRKLKEARRSDYQNSLEIKRAKLQEHQEKNHEKRESST